MKYSSARAFREFIWFFIASGSGLVVDLAGFFALTQVGFEPWLANAASSTVSVTCVYFIATRYSFKVSTSWTTYAIFIIWYAASIALFSYLIELTHVQTAIPAFVAKLLSVPISFVMNFAFGKILFRQEKVLSDPAHAGPP